MIFSRQNKHFQLSNEARAAICIALRKGQSQASIAREFNVSRTSISRINKRFKETGSFIPNPRTGGLKKLSDRAIRTIVRIVHRNPRIQKKDLIAASPTQAHYITIAKALATRNLFRRKAKKSVPLSNNLANQRLQFTQY